MACMKAMLIIGSLFSYIAAIALNAYCNIPGLSPFNETIGDLSHKYETGITPSDATFGIWSLIYLWLLALVIYCQTLICRSYAGTPLYISPGFIPPVFFVSFIITMIGNPLWIVVWLMEKLHAAAALLVLGALTAFVCLLTSCQQLDKRGGEMTKKGLLADIWTTRILVHNGCALYLGWVSCAAIINVITVAHYGYEVSMTYCCFAGLGALNVIIIGWFFLEIVSADRQLRYVFAHYIAFLAALAGSYVKNYDPEVSYTVYSLAILILCSVLAAAKLVTIIVRSIYDPIHYEP